MVMVWNGESLYHATRNDGAAFLRISVHRSFFYLPDTTREKKGNVRRDMHGECAGSRNAAFGKALTDAETQKPVD